MINIGLRQIVEDRVTSCSANGQHLQLLANKISKLQVDIIDAKKDGKDFSKLVDMLKKMNQQFNACLVSG